MTARNALVSPPPPATPSSPAASVRAAVLSNAGTLLVFRVSGADAEVLASEFDPLPPAELVDQSPYTAWLRRGIGHRHVDLSPRLYPPRGRLPVVCA